MFVERHREVVAFFEARSDKIAMGIESTKIARKPAPPNPTRPPSSSPVAPLRRQRLQRPDPRESSPRQ